LNWLEKRTKESIKGLNTAIFSDAEEVK
jgi:hypothetical protein